MATYLTQNEVTCLFAVLLLALQERGEDLSNAFCFSEVWDSVDANKVIHIREFLSIIAMGKLQALH